MKVLLTGASGLVGRHFLAALTGTCYTVAVARGGHVQGADETIFLDLDAEWSNSDLPRDADVVIHLAQSDHHREFPERARNVFAVNTASTVRLLDFSRATGVKKFILASTGGVYGSGSEEFSEDRVLAATGDLGFYASTRLCSEILADCYRAFVDVICLRFFFVYGPGQKSGMLVPRLVQSVQSGKPIQLTGRNGLSINPIHASDAAAAVKAALDLKGSHKLNVAGPEVLTLRQMAEMIGAQLAIQPVFETGRDETSKDLVGDITGMRSLLHEPTVRFEFGIATLLR